MPYYRRRLRLPVSRLLPAGVITWTIAGTILLTPGVIVYTASWCIIGTAFGLLYMFQIGAKQR